MMNTHESCERYLGNQRDNSHLTCHHSHGHDRTATREVCTHCSRCTENECCLDMGNRRSLYSLPQVELLQQLFINARILAQ